MNELQGRQNVTVSANSFPPPVSDALLSLQKFAKRYKFRKSRPAIFGPLIASSVQLLARANCFTAECACFPLSSAILLRLNPDMMQSHNFAYADQTHMFYRVVQTHSTCSTGSSRYVRYLNPDFPLCTAGGSFCWTRSWPRHSWWTWAA